MGVMRRRTLVSFLLVALLCWHSEQQAIPLDTRPLIEARSSSTAVTVPKEPLPEGNAEYTTLPLSEMGRRSFFWALYAAFPSSDTDAKCS